MAKRVQLSSKNKPGNDMKRLKRSLGSTKKCKSGFSKKFAAWRKSSIEKELYTKRLEQQPEFAKQPLEGKEVRVIKEPLCSSW